MAFDPDKIRTGLIRPSLDHRRRGALLDNHLVGNRDAHVDSYADIRCAGEGWNAGDNSCNQKSF
jgi:hypothetical protein